MTFKIMKVLQNSVETKIISTNLWTIKYWKLKLERTENFFPRIPFEFSVTLTHQAISRRHLLRISKEILDNEFKLSDNR